MYHSITFGDKNTWDDWRIVPSSRPLFSPPSQKTKTLDIPGGDGLIDLSESLTGYPVYENRTGSIEFIVMNDFKPWNEAYSDIMGYLHGRTMRAVLEDDPLFFYEGRFAVKEWKSQKDWSRITIEYNVGPYKWTLLSSIEDWLWDPFNFQNGIIKSSLYRSLSITSSSYRKISVTPEAFGRAPSCPSFIINTNYGQGATVRFVNPTLGIDLTKVLPDGTTQDPELVFYGDSTVTIYVKAVYGSGTVSVSFREGRL